MENKPRHFKTRRRIRSVAVLPSLMTLANGVFGFASIHFAARGMNDPDGFWMVNPPLKFFAASAWMIFFAMVADVLDGFLARRSGTASNFGGQLDSLCDVISFGVAPAFLMLRMVESHFIHAIGGPANPAFGSFLGKLLWMAAAIYLCCAILRLARFNVENSTDETSHLTFSGLPSPAAAGVVASMVLLLKDLDVEKATIEQLSDILILGLPFITVAVGLLMVSRFPYKHVVNQHLHGKRPFRHVVYVVLVLLALCLQFQLTAALVSLIFALSGVVRWFLKRKQIPTATSTIDPAGPANP